eukprot:14127831-Alexandrium_andersonii.AAC.1
MAATGTDPMAGRPTGGVALLVRRPLPLFQPTPRTPAFAEFQRQGRVMLGYISVGARVPVLL